MFIYLWLFGLFVQSVFDLFWHACGPRFGIIRTSGAQHKWTKLPNPRKPGTRNMFVHAYWIHSLNMYWGLQCYSAAQELAAMASSGNVSTKGGFGYGHSRVPAVSLRPRRFIHASMDGVDGWMDVWMDAVMGWIGLMGWRNGLY